MPDDPTTPKKNAIVGMSINSSEKLIEALEAVGGVQDARDSRAEAEADMRSKGFEIEEPDPATTPQDNDQQQAMALLLKKYIKRLIVVGGLHGDTSKLF